MAPRVSIKVELDQKPVTDGLKRLQASFKTSFGEIQAALNLAKRAFGPLVGAIGDMIKAANESEKAQRGLAGALRLHGAESSTALRSMQAFNSSLQAQIGLDDDAAAALQTKLLVLGVLPSQLERATRATIGLSDATGKDLTRASREVAKAFQESGQRAQELESLFQISEAQAATFAGQTKILGANMGELQETLGAIITKSPAVADSISGINDAVKDLVDFLSRNADRVGAFFDRIVRAFQKPTGAELGLLLPEGPAGALLAAHGVGPAGARDPIPQALRDYERRLMGQKFPSGGGGASRGRGGGSRKGGRSSLADLSSEASSILGGSSITEQWAIEEESRQAHAEAMRAIGEAQLQQEIELNEREFMADLQAFDSKERLRQRELNNNSSFFDKLVGIHNAGSLQLSQIDRMVSEGLSSIGASAVKGIGSMLTGIFSLVADGSQSIGAAMGQLFGGLLQTIGQSLLSLSATLGLLAFVTGGATAGYAAGLAVAGAAAIAGGVGLQAATRGGSTKAGSGGSGGYSSGASTVVGGYVPRRGSPPPRESTTVVINVGHFYGGSTPSAAGRALRDLIRESERGLPGGPAFAGPWTR